MTLTPNDGARTSRLKLDRYATDELSGAERAEVDASIDTSEEAKAYLAGLDDARGQVRAFDAVALRSRARQGAVTDVEPLPEPANRPSWAWLSPVIALAAALLLVALASLQMPTTEVDPSYIGVRSGKGLHPYVLSEDRTLVPYDGESLGQGDVVGFKVDSTRRHHVVVLSVDGEGQISVFWPETGSDEPQPVNGQGLQSLPGSVTLDDARGPEVFIAVFDTPADEARETARRAFQSGGVAGLLEWADGDPDVDAVVVSRK